MVSRLELTRPADMARHRQPETHWGVACQRKEIFPLLEDRRMGKRRGRYRILGAQLRPYKRSSSSHGLMTPRSDRSSMFQTLTSYFDSACIHGHRPPFTEVLARLSCSSSARMLQSQHAIREVYKLESDLTSTYITDASGDLSGIPCPKGFGGGRHVGLTEGIGVAH